MSLRLLTLHVRTSQSATVPLCTGDANVVTREAVVRAGVARGCACPGRQHEILEFHPLISSATGLPIDGPEEATPVMLSNAQWSQRTVADRRTQNQLVPNSRCAASGCYEPGAAASWLLTGLSISEVPPCPELHEPRLDDRRCVPPGHAVILDLLEDRVRVERVVEVDVHIEPPLLRDDLRETQVELVQAVAKLGAGRKTPEPKRINPSRNQVDSRAGREGSSESRRRDSVRVVGVDNRTDHALERPADSDAVPTGAHTRRTP